MFKAHNGVPQGVEAVMNDCPVADNKALKVRNFKAKHVSLVVELFYAYDVQTRNRTTESNTVALNIC